MQGPKNDALAVMPPPSRRAAYRQTASRFHGVRHAASYAPGHVKAAVLRHENNEFFRSAPNEKGTFFFSSLCQWLVWIVTVGASSLKVISRIVTT